MGHDLVAGPENLIGRIKRLSEDRKGSVLSWFRTCLGIFGGTEDQVGDVLVGLEEVLLEGGEPLRLLVGVCTVSLDVIKEYCKGTYAKGIHGVELL